MSSQISKQGKVRDALSRLDDVEKHLRTVATDMQGIADFVNGKAREQKEFTISISEIVDAIVDVVGAEKVDAALSAIRARKDAEVQTKLRETVADSVTDGTLAVAETVTEESLLLFSEKVGEVSVRPGLAFAPVKNFNATTKEKCIGKKVGDSVEGVSNSSLTVEGIYVFVQPTPVEPNKE